MGPHYLSIVTFYFVGRPLLIPTNFSLRLVTAADYLSPSEEVLLDQLVVLLILDQKQGLLTIQLDWRNLGTVYN